LPALGAFVNSPFPAAAVAGRINSAHDIVGWHLGALTPFHAPGKDQSASSTKYCVGPGDSGQRGTSPFIRGGKCAGVCFLQFHTLFILNVPWVHPPAI
jgi:hypothetical protein